MNNFRLLKDLPIVKHYVHFWGDFVDVFNSDASSVAIPRPLFIAEFAPDSEDQDWVYATAGMSNQAMAASSNGSSQEVELRAELFIYSRQRNNQLRNLLLSLASYPFDKKTFLGPGHTIPGNEGVVENSPLTDILFLRPLGEPPDFELVHYQDKYHIRILWVIPIYPSERQFVKQNGWEALVDLFYKNKTDTSDFTRKRIV